MKGLSVYFLEVPVRDQNMISPTSLASVAVVVLLYLVFTSKRQGVICYRKAVVGFPLLLIVSFFSVFFVFNRLRKPYALRFAHSGFSIIAKSIGLSFSARGVEHLEKHKAAVVIANHQHSVDFLGIAHLSSHLGDHIGITKKEMLWLSGTAGLHCWLAGCIFLDRANSEKAVNALRHVPERLVRDQMKLVVFPEGTRRNTGEIHPFKKGAFRIAVEAQIPIIPVVFSRYYFSDVNDHRFDDGHVVMSVLPPVPTKGLSVSEVDELVSRVHRLVSDEFQSLNEEVIPQNEKDRLRRTDDIQTVSRD